MAVDRDYLAHADVWTVLDLIAAEFDSDPTSVQCFDLRLVKRASELAREWRAAQRGGEAEGQRQAELGRDAAGNIVVNFVAAGRIPWHLTFTPEQAVAFAQTLLSVAREP